MRFSIQIYLLSASLSMLAGMGGGALAQPALGLGGYLNLMAYNPLRIDHAATPLLKSYPCPGFEAGLLLSHPLSKKISIKVGAGYTLLPYNLGYKFRDDIPRILTQTHSSWHWAFNVTQYVFPLSVEKEFVYRKVRFLSSIGFKIHNTTVQTHEETAFRDGYYLTDTGTNIKLFYLELWTPSAKKRWMVSYHLKVGGYIKNASERLTWALTAQYSPMSVSKGWHEFYNLSFQSKGTQRLGVNALGLELGYKIWSSKKQR